MQGSGPGRGAAWTRHGQRFQGRRRVSGSPGNPENGLVSKGGFQDESCFWPSVSKLSRFGHGVTLEGPFHHPACTEGIGAAWKGQSCRGQHGGWAQSPCLPIISGSRAAHYAHHTSLFAAPLWVARASHCPSTIVVACSCGESGTGSCDLGQPSCAPSFLLSLAVLGEAAFVALLSEEAGGWTSRQHHRPC